MSVGSVGSGAQAADLMKILVDGQDKSLDMAKKLVKMAVSEKVQSVSSMGLEGLGENIDVTG